MVARMSAQHMPQRKPIKVSAVDQVFGGNVHNILPPMSEIPDEFSRQGHPWVRWQRDWFYKGLTRYPVPKDGIDLRIAMSNLACVQRSFEPKHEHKEAGVAYLASLWFKSPDGDLIPKSAGEGA